MVIRDQSADPVYLQARNRRRGSLLGYIQGYLRRTKHMHCSEAAAARACRAVRHPGRTCMQAPSRLHRPVHSHVHVCKRHTSLKCMSCSAASCHSGTQCQRVPKQDIKPNHVNLCGFTCQTALAAHVQPCCQGRSLVRRQGAKAKPSARRTRSAAWTPRAGSSAAR